MEKKCRFCPRVCHKQEHLDRHERTHTKIRPYRCEECEKHFVRSDTLKRHQKLHTADGRKESRRIAKTIKRPPVDTNHEALHPDQSTESSLGYSPIQEMVPSQIYFDTSEAWRDSSFDPTFANTFLPYPEWGVYASYFDESFPAFEEVSIKSASSDFTADSDALRVWP